MLGFGLVAPVLFLLLWRISPAASFTVLGLSHVLLMAPIVRPTLQWYGPVVTRFATAEKEVWLTIDDGPDPVDTPLILDLLDRHGARATFFVKGKHVRKYPQIAAEIVRRGHTLGNHSNTHPSPVFWCLGPRAMRRQIDGCTAELAAVPSLPRTDLFRAPVGMKNFFVHPILRERGMTLVAWSARGYDGVDPWPMNAARRILRQVAPGAVIVTHEGRRDRRGNSINYPCVEAIVQKLSADGYRFVIPAESAFLYG